MSEETSSHGDSTGGRDPDNNGDDDEQVSVVNVN